jgi:OPT family oligopeptide transporter
VIQVWSPKAEPKLMVNRRRQVIIRERLKFPSGTSTAVLIGVLHGQGKGGTTALAANDDTGGFASLAPKSMQEPYRESSTLDADLPPTHVAESASTPFAPSPESEDWAANIRLLTASFILSGGFTVCTYFFPVLRNIPMLGTRAASRWLWTFNPSLAYVGQGIIMGPETTLHMALGAILGWAVLSPLAKIKGWAPGEIDDWENGSKGWVVWISLAIMLADAIVSLGYISIRPLSRYSSVSFSTIAAGWSRILKTTPRREYALIPDVDDDEANTRHLPTEVHTSVYDSGEPNDSGGSIAPEDAPPHQQINTRSVCLGLISSVLLCVVTTHITFGDLVPLYAIVIAVFMALVLSIMGVRALGETDLNPVSGISKLAQLFFALIIPQSNKSSVLINLVAGAVVGLFWSPNRTFRRNQYAN